MRVAGLVGLAFVERVLVPGVIVAVIFWVIRRVSILTLFASRSFAGVPFASTGIDTF